MAENRKKAVCMASNNTLKKGRRLNPRRRGERRSHPSARKTIQNRPRPRPNTQKALSQNLPETVLNLPTETIAKTPLSDRLPATMASGNGVGEPLGRNGGVYEVRDDFVLNYPLAECELFL